MNTLLAIIIVFLYAIIIIQDFKYRAITWYVFPLLFISYLVLLNRTDNLNLNIIILNMIMVSLQLLIVTLVYSIKEKKWINIAKSKIGLADILLLYILALSFHTITFIVFLTSALILSLLLHKIIEPAMKQKSRIPLAAYLAIYYILFISILSINSINPLEELLFNHFII